MDGTTTSPTSPSKADTPEEAIAILTQEIDKLVERMGDGAAKIEMRKSQGINSDSMEDKWVVLLRQYEAKCQLRRDLGYAEPLPD